MVCQRVHLAVLPRSIPIQSVQNLAPRIAGRLALAPLRTGGFQPIGEPASTIQTRRPRRVPIRYDAGVGRSRRAQA